MGELLKGYSKCLKSEKTPVASTRRQTIHKFRHKVYFYLDWIAGSFAQFQQFSLPLIDLLLTEHKLHESSNNKLDAVSVHSYEVCVYPKE